MWLSREVLWKIVDARIVDGLLVNGSAAASRAAGWLGSRLQTGEVGVYVVLFVIGVLAVVRAAVGEPMYPRWVLTARRAVPGPTGVVARLSPVAGAETARSA